MEEEDKTSSEFNQLATHCDGLLDEGDIKGVVAAVRTLQGSLQPASGVLSVLQKGRLACLLIDVGAFSQDKAMVQSGLDLFERNAATFSEKISPSSLEYNLGNAKKSLYDIAFLKRQERFRPESIELLIEAKAHYWKALKLVRDGAASPELFVNLGNVLDQCGRVVESLMWYDRAINTDPALGMAHFNRGLALLFLKSISDSYTIKLLDESRCCFSLAESSGHLPRELIEQARFKQKYLAESLLKLGYGDEKIREDEHRNVEEYEAHDLYWKWCLENYLALSEHSLYCRCAGARRDDLSIPMQSKPIGGEFVPELELLLNRMKSEFCMARALYYQSAVTASETCWDTKPFEGTFTELYESEEIGLRAEFLRTSFRLCFGVLDKIARGVANLFDLASSNEALYFESFWKPSSESKKREERRWEIINRQENRALVALYSLATDLNRAGGEWGHFKEYRNQLEHGIFLLRKNEAVGLGDRNLVDLADVKTVEAAEFAECTFRMLQFTVSAIFSFAFCVRIEGLKRLGSEGLTVNLDKKIDIGKP